MATKKTGKTQLETIATAQPKVTAKPVKATAPKPTAHTKSYLVLRDAVEPHFTSVTKKGANVDSEATALCAEIAHRLLTRSLDTVTAWAEPRITALLAKRAQTSLEQYKDKKGEDATRVLWGKSGTARLSVQWLSEVIKISDTETVSYNVKVHTFALLGKGFAVLEHEGKTLLFVGRETSVVRQVRDYIVFMLHLAGDAKKIDTHIKTSSKIEKVQDKTRLRVRALAPHAVSEDMKQASLALPE